VAAWLLRCPLVIHEQNAVPGITNRILARLATHVLEAFPGSFPASAAALAVGNPLREAIVHIVPPEQRLAGRSGAMRLLVLGGSLGARALNQRVPEALAEIPAGQRPEVRHQCGEQHLDATRARYESLGVAAEVVEFVDDMAGAYAWADLAICRAGAMTVSELAMAGVPAILVPFPYAVDDHQAANAGFLAGAGAAIMRREAELDVRGLAELVAGLGRDRARLADMAARARSLAQPEAAAAVARHCMGVVHG
jgi:UDP-N-acetylglucosamine--N-acetylmuramyl-(pentapeptide) pyrophosphoryl-undecaprenol N-acetylglucosamine transferase